MQYNSLNPQERILAAGPMIGTQQNVFGFEKV
jgi:hypothetical protein